MKKISYLSKKDVIHCPTQEEFEAILKLANSNLNPDFWEEYEEDTCYRPSKNLFDSTEYYEGRGKRIHPASSFLPEEFYESGKKVTPQEFESNSINQQIVGPTPSIDNVTTDRLHVVLRLVNINIPKEVLDKIIDVVELIELKGGATSLDDIDALKQEWGKTPNLNKDLYVADGKNTPLKDFLETHKDIMASPEEQVRTGKAWQETMEEYQKSKQFKTSDSGYTRLKNAAMELGMDSRENLKRK